MNKLGISTHRELSAGVGGKQGGGGSGARVTVHPRQSPTEGVRLQQAC